MFRRPLLAAALAAAVVALPAVALIDPPHLEPVATYDTLLGASGAEIVSVRDRDGAAVLTNVGGGDTVAGKTGGSVDVLDLSDPDDPKRVVRVKLAGVTPNSAAIHPQHDYFLVVTGSAGLVGKVHAFALDGTFIDSTDVGIQPDSIAIAPNGQYAVVANEAEGVANGNDGGAGSLSIVDLSGFTGKFGDRLAVRAAALPTQEGNAGFSTGRTDDLARLPITNAPGTLEPESVAFSRDSRHAYVTLQENNGVVRLELRTGDLVFFGLGQASHAADLTVDPNNPPSFTESLTAFREPDGIAVDGTGRFFVTADEGDTRNAAASSGPRGGRTVSVFDARTGAFIADTGNQLDAAAAAVGRYPDSRSNRGGSEPEVLDLTHERGLTLVAVGLERANAVALVDLTHPSAPRVIDVAATGLAPEGVKFLRRHGRLYVVTANEVSGTVSVLRVAF